MLTQMISEFTGQSPETITSMMHTSPRKVYDNPIYQDLVDGLDTNTLAKTTGDIRHYLDEQLPPLVDVYLQKYDLDEFPLTGRMLCNWVMAFANMPTALPRLIETHDSVSKDIMRDVLPDIIHVLDGAPVAAKMWQTAIIIFVMPMISHN